MTEIVRGILTPIPINVLLRLTEVVEMNTKFRERVKRFPNKIVTELHNFGSTFDGFLNNFDVIISPSFSDKLRCYSKR